MPSWTERPVDISDTYLTEADALPAVSYAALGHIHRPQAITRGGLAARYAGSPLQLDFGEAGEDKSVVVVDADPGRPVRVELVPLHAGRRLADFTGTLEELRAQAAQIGDAFVRAVIVSEEPIPNLAAAAKDAAPQATFVADRPALRRLPGRRPGAGRRRRRGTGPGGPVPRVPDRPCARRRGRRRHPGDLHRPARRRRQRGPGIFREEARLRTVLGEEPGRQPDERRALISGARQRRRRRRLAAARGAGMRPLQLSFSGIRSYPGAVGPLDFTGKTLIAIVGDTGAGKSTILEAITPRACTATAPGPTASTRR